MDKELVMLWVKTPRYDPGFKAGNLEIVAYGGYGVVPGFDRQRKQHLYKIRCSCCQRTRLYVQDAVRRWEREKMEPQCFPITKGQSALKTKPSRGDNHDPFINQVAKVAWTGNKSKLVELTDVLRKDKDLR